VRTAQVVGVTVVLLSAHPNLVSIIDTLPCLFSLQIRSVPLWLDLSPSNERWNERAGRKLAPKWSRSTGSSPQGRWRLLNVREDTGVNNALLFTAIGNYTKGGENVGWTRDAGVTAQAIYMPYVSMRSPIVLKSLSQTRVCFPLVKRRRDERVGGGTEKGDGSRSARRSVKARKWSNSLVPAALATV
jgi:hypothetical protein